MTISGFIRAWLLLAPFIPSIIVAIFNVYNLVSNQALRIALNNHAIILLLCCGLVECLTGILWHIYFLFTGTALSSTPAFCQAWVFISSSANVSIYILMAWASIERHILIFHSSWFATVRKRFFFHYLPLAVCMLWPVTFYFTIFLILSCDVAFDYKRMLCGRYECITSVRWIALCDSILHYMMPPFVVAFFSMTLLARVLYHKYHIHHRIDWRNYKKMASQLLPISALYMLLLFPPMALYTAHSAGLSRNLGADYFSDAFFFCNWIVLFTPFASVISLPELRPKCTQLFLFWRSRNIVHPEGHTLTRLPVRRTAAIAPTTH